MPNTFAFINKEQLTTAAGSVTFSNIPQTYTDLIIYFTARSNRNFKSDDTEIRVNGATTGTILNYYSDGTIMGQYGSSGSYVGWSVSGATATAEAFGYAEVYLSNYTSSTAKTFQGRGGATMNEGNRSELSKTVVTTGNTSPVTSLVIAPGDGTEFPAYSRFYLYGIKRA